MKKLFFTLCALCLCGTMWGADVWTDDNRPDVVYQDETTQLYFYVTGEGEEAYANITYSEASTSNYSSLSALSIPESVSYEGVNYPVTRIAPFAFYNAATIEGEITIPAYITALGEGAFTYCTGITQVTFEYSETPLLDEKSDNNASLTQSFRYCSALTTVYLNRDVTSGHEGYLCTPFCYNVAVTTVYVGENVKSIPGYMFRCASATLATVYSYAENPPALGTGVFSSASSNLTLYTAYEYVNNYRLDNDWLEEFGRDNIHAYDSDTDPDWPTDESAFQVDGIWYEAIEGQDGECMIIADQGGEVYSGEITIPETVVSSIDGNTYTVTRIDDSAFASSNISGHVIIPANILNVGKSAFEGCSGITEVTYEYSPTALQDENNANSAGAGGSFHSCSGLTTVHMYRDVTVGRDGYLCTPFCYDSSITTLYLGPRVTYIPSFMFYNTSLANVYCYNANPTSLGSSTPLSFGSTYTIYVPVGAEDAYATAWSSYTDHEGVLSNAYAVTISELAELDGSYYATYYNDNAVDIYPQGGTLSDGSVYDVTTYAATGVDVEENTAYLELVEVGATVPAGVAVLVDGNVAGTYTVIETTAAQTASYSGTNDLYGFVYDEETEEYVAVAPDAGSYYFYKLTLDSDNDSNSLGFYWGAEEGGTFTGEANKAYLVLPQTALTGLSAVKLKKGEGDNDTTGITSVEVENETNTVKGIYTIQGVRVSNMNQPGLYIVDGKKVLKR